jgi:ribA/ribD-fused uncharacterized protein
MMSGGPEDQPLLTAYMQNQLSEIPIISSNVQNIDKRLSQIAESIDFVTNKLKEVTNELDKVKSENTELKTSNSALKIEMNKMKSQISYLECQSRRNNLLFDGLAEKQNETWEECETILKRKLHEYLGHVLNVEGLQFERVHRIGQHTGIRCRQIVAKFSSYKQRDLVWSKRFNITDPRQTGFWISEDYPPEIKQNRDKLRPLLMAAKRSPSVTSSSLRLDRLFINNKMYTVDTINQLPEELQPQNASVINTDHVVVFSSSDAIFSNLHPCNIKIEGVTYNSTEQYIQYAKSILFNDKVSSEKIMQESNTYKQMRLGKHIKQFRKETWLQKVKSVMFRANLAKYEQNPHARHALLQTREKKLGEATIDPFYGIGERLSSKTVTNHSTWAGNNLMGTVLEEVRSKLMQ